MKTVVKKLYEAMFLVDSAEAASDWDGITGLIRNILEKAGAEIVSVRKWDECRLAYDIKGKNRGTYILCYFRVEGGKISDIERDIRLTERVMRVLVINAEHMTQKDIEKETPAMRAEHHVPMVEATVAEKESKEGVEEEVELPEEGFNVIDVPDEPEVPGEK